MGRREVLFIDGEGHSRGRFGGKIRSSSLDASSSEGTH